MQGPSKHSDKQTVPLAFKRLWNLARQTFAPAWSLSKVFILRNLVIRSLRKIWSENTQKRRPHRSSIERGPFWEFLICWAFADDQSLNIPSIVWRILENANCLINLIFWSFRKSRFYSIHCQITFFQIHSIYVLEEKQILQLRQIQEAYSKDKWKAHLAELGWADFTMFNRRPTGSPFLSLFRPDLLWWCRNWISQYKSLIGNHTGASVSLSNFYCHSIVEETVFTGGYVHMLWNCIPSRFAIALLDGEDIQKTLTSQQNTGSHWNVSWLIRSWSDFDAERREKCIPWKLLVFSRCRSGNSKKQKANNLPRYKLNITFQKITDWFVTWHMTNWYVGNT